MKRKSQKNEGERQRKMKVRGEKKKKRKEESLMTWVSGRSPFFRFFWLKP